MFATKPTKSHKNAQKASKKTETSQSLNFLRLLSLFVARPLFVGPNRQARSSDLTET
jgi:hypothetical protein